MPRFFHNLLNGHVLNTEVDTIEVDSYSPVRDPEWSYVDGAGHYHGKDALIDALVYVPDDPDDDSEWATGHIECRLCGEEIRPGMIGPSPFRQFIPGMTHYRLCDEVITEDEAKTIERAFDILRRHEERHRTYGTHA